MLRIQSAITLETSEPEPDIVVAKGPPQRYVDRHPQGPDVGLVIEVAESSLNRDRMKANTYAAGEVPEYWIVTLKDRTLEVFDSPRDGAYQQHRILSMDEHLTLSSVISTTDHVPVSSLFPVR
jgi:Uma2 family endonuclease